MDRFPRIERALMWATLVDEATLREWLLNVVQHHDQHGSADPQHATVVRPIRTRSDRPHIRDKIAQSKAKGMWMGGTNPIGYRAGSQSGDR